MNLKLLTEIVHANSVAHGWWENDFDRHPLALLFLVQSELAEAGEEYRDHHDISEVYYNGNKPEGFPVELADAVIRILDICGYYKIDLEKVLLEKHEYNKTRPYKHGKRA